MIRRALFLWIFVLFSLALACAVGELYVRWQGWRDIDGTFYFRNRPIPPYVIPLNGARTLIDRYLHDSSGSLLYDPDLGWNNRPHASTPGRMQSTNSFGLRADREYTHEMRPGMFRVSMFGDSFIFGADVDLQDSPAVRLEGLLKQRGIDAEVLNFGVGGFGFDQAYLHYHRDSSQFDTSVIVQGLQMENVGRDVTIFRIVSYPGTQIPFSKPRYVLRNGKLELINHPAIAPEDVPKTLANFPSWPLAKYEAFYAERYRSHWYSHSKLISTLVELWGARRGPWSETATDVYAVDGEGMNITVRLLEAYRDEVTRSGKPFVLIFLPRPDTIRAALTGKPDPWQPHRERLLGFTIVDPTARMVTYAKERGVDALYQSQGHYTPAGYLFVAEALAEALVKLAPKDRSPVIQSSRLRH
jgi:hypothetical protein